MSRHRIDARTDFERPLILLEDGEPIVAEGTASQGDYPEIGKAGGQKQPRTEVAAMELDAGLF